MLVASLLTWLVLIGLVFAVFALMRQIGLLHERLAPLGALTLQSSLEPGDRAPSIVAATLSGAKVQVGGPRESGLLQILLFVAPTCPVCKVLLPTAKSLAKAEGLNLVVIGDGDVEEHRRMAEALEIALAQFVVSADVGHAYRVGKLPHAVLIGDSGIILAQGLVNTREHLESLLVAHETGMQSVQQYLKSRKSIEHV
jgi:methylamine dehydrogenase accessory protein MauD